MGAISLFYKQQIEDFEKYKIEYFENIIEYLKKLNDVLIEELSKNNQKLNLPDWVEAIIELYSEVFKRLK